MAGTRETLLGYWLGWVQGPSLQETPGTVNTVALAFAMPQADNSLDYSELTTDYTQDVICAGTAALRARNVTVLLSIGGSAVGNWPELDPATFAQNVLSALDEWGCDGVDLDNEGEDAPGQNFIEVILALRKALGPDRPITLPVYMGTGHDAYLAKVKHAITAVYTMAYWQNYDEQIAMQQAYAGLVGPGKVGIGVADFASPSSQNTNFAIVPRLAKYKPKAGMMLWNLNSGTIADAEQWCNAIAENMNGG